MADNIIERIACTRVITARDTKTSELAISNASLALKVKEIEAKQVKLTATEKQLAQAQEALTSSSQTNKNTIAVLQQQIATLQESVNSQAAVIDALYVQASAQTDFTMLPQEVRTILLAYRTKYPEAEVIYSGRTLPGRADKPFSMRVQCWAQAGIGTPEAIGCVKAANVFVLDVMKRKGCSFHRACDFAAMKMKVWITSGIPYKYQLDSNTTGLNEFWKFFIELYYSMQKYGIGDDCDGWMLVFYVLCRTAGIPKELLRNIGCTTRGSGEGHATNSYFASDCVWRHVNSTTPYGMPDQDILTLPKLNDPTDAMGPGSTWFSFDEEQSWAGDAINRSQTFLDWAGYLPTKQLPKMLRNVKVRLL